MRRLKSRTLQILLLPLNRWAHCIIIDHNNNNNNKHIKVKFLSLLGTKKAFRKGNNDSQDPGSTNQQFGSYHNILLVFIIYHICSYKSWNYPHTLRTIHALSLPVKTPKKPKEKGGKINKMSPIFALKSPPAISLRRPTRL